jgi:hypothetical protein
VRGSGYSSLAYLRRLPVQAIKIDRSFVMDMCDNPNDATIVGSTIDLGKNLGLEVVAEGVETQEAWDALREQGCTLAQGYFIGRPIPADEMAALLEELAPRTGPEPLAVAETLARTELLGRSALFAALLFERLLRLLLRELLGLRGALHHHLQDADVDVAEKYRTRDRRSGGGAGSFQASERGSHGSNRPHPPE